MTKHVAPSVNLTAFNCPHCGAFSAQQWFEVHAAPIGGTPTYPLDEALAAIDKERFSSPSVRVARVMQARKEGSTEPYLLSGQRISQAELVNVHVSRCVHCGKSALWSYHRQVVPDSHTVVAPNADLDEDIRIDFNEAVGIVDKSPRGAAALLRLALQKLCKQLGEPGDNINQDIASLVAKGLDPDMQIALDTVRVIGNETVHPGVIDLRDDRDTALFLFDIINSIAYQMITHKKQVRAIYGRLPPDKLKAIEDRNKGAIAKAQKEKDP